jgi:hypothetical protein
MEEALMTTPDTVRQIELPAEAAAISTLTRIDYDDAFLVRTDRAGNQTAEQWARAVLDDAPASTRAMLSRGWASLGLRLGPAQPDRHRVLGWEIRRSSPDIALLGARGRLGLSGELLFRRQDDALLFATFVRLDNPVTRTLWRRIAARHRQIVRDLLEDASRRLGTG